MLQRRSDITYGGAESSEIGATSTLKVPLCKDFCIWLPEGLTFWRKFLLLASPMAKLSG